jgi:hypothetical protein
MGGEGVVVRHEKETLVFVLHLHEIPDRSEIITQVKVPGGPDPAQYCIHKFCCALKGYAKL